MSIFLCACSVQPLSCVRLFETPWTTACQASLSITNSQSLSKFMSLSWWCHPTISSSVVPFSSCPQSFPASGAFPMSQLFASGGQSIGVSASTSGLPINTQDWSPLGWTMFLLVICISSLKQISTQVFCPFFDWIFYIEFYELFICFGYKLLFGHIICKYFSTIWYLNGFFCYVKCF